MDALVGFLMLIYCIGGLVYGFFYGFEQRLILQIIVAGAGSIIILFGYFVAWVKNFKLPSFKLRKNNTQEIDEDMKDLPFDCDEKSALDFKCLHYLKHRATETQSKEMMDLVVQLNTLLFAGGCHEEKKNE